jgi:hypothetical protein
MMILDERFLVTDRFDLTFSFDDPIVDPVRL